MTASPLLLLALLAAGPDETIARAGSSDVTASMLRERLALDRSLKGTTPAENLLEDLLNEALLAEEARARGMAQDPEVRREVDRERRRLAAQALSQAEFDGPVQVADAQLLELFHQSSDSLRLKMIVYASEADARAGLERLKKGAGFAAEARHSLDPAGKASGGDVGLKVRGQLEKALVQVCFAARPGELLGPIALELGFALVRVEEKNLGDDALFAKRKDELRRFLEQQLRGQRKAHALAQLRKQKGVALDEAFLQASGAGRSATPEELAHPLGVAGDQPVLYGEVLDELQRVFGDAAQGHGSGFTVKREIAWKLLDQKLLEHVALERGFGDAPAVRGALPHREREAVVRAWSNRLRRAAPAPSEAQLAERYRVREAQFRTPASRPCAHILVPLKDQAELLLKRAQSEPFAELAREFSRDVRTAPSGGSFGSLTAEDRQRVAKEEPALAKALEKGKPGAIVGPVQSRAGWHLVRCEAERPARTAPLAEVRPMLVDELTREAGDAAVRGRIASLRAQAKLSIDRAALQRALAGAAP